MALLEAHDIWKCYADTAVPVEVLRGAEFAIEEGESVAIYGTSGAGKSTLLHILGGLDRPTRGRVLAAGMELGVLGDVELAHFRNREIGFVFQFYHLLPEFTALENAMLPALIAGLGRHEAERRGREALDAMGLAGRAGHRPAMLSGGEQQRVALARSAVMRPRAILADEPTGNLDRETGRKVWEYLLDLNRRMGIALVAVTHNRDLGLELSRCMELRDGIVQPMKGAA